MTVFYMGNDKHEAKETAILTLENKRHTFAAVHDDFPIPEDGIVGNLFIHSYKFNLSNKSLEFDGKIYLLEDNGTVIPKNSVKIITLETRKEKGEVIIENSPYIPDLIYSIRNSKIRIPINIESDSDIKLATDDIKYRCIITNLVNKRINYVTEKEFSTRLRLLKENTRLSHIEQDERVLIVKIITSYHDVFSLPGYPLPCTKLFSHRIVLKDQKPINIRQYMHPECHKEEISNKIDEMLTKTVISHSDSPYNAPLWVIPKKRDAFGKGKWRIVVFFRKLNEKTD